MFYRILEQTETFVQNEQHDNNIEKGNQEIKLRRASPKKLYEHLTMLIIQTTKSINENSSSAIYEAPLFGTPAINIGDRQHKRFESKIIKNFKISKLNQNELRSYLRNYKSQIKYSYGTGQSNKKFIKIIKSKSFWKTSTQKFFSDYL